jgi:putative membrane protein
MKAFMVVALAVAGGAAFQQAQGQEMAFAGVTHTYAAEVDAPSDVVDFLRAATDERLINIDEAILASRNGRSQEIRDYAGKMMNDQLVMLGYIKKIAVLRGLILPERLSKENREGYEKLAALSGKRFDKKFVNQMIDDRTRDLDLFRQALDSSDAEVREFAEFYLPLIQKQLERVKELKREV